MDRAWHPTKDIDFITTRGSSARRGLSVSYFLLVTTYFLLGVRRSMRREDNSGSFENISLNLTLGILFGCSSVARQAGRARARGQSAWLREPSLPPRSGHRQGGELLTCCSNGAGSTSRSPSPQAAVFDKETRLRQQAGGLAAAVLAAAALAAAALAAAALAAAAAVAAAAALDLSRHSERVGAARGA